MLPPDLLCITSYRHARPETQQARASPQLRQQQVEEVCLQPAAAEPAEDLELVAAAAAAAAAAEKPRPAPVWPCEEQYRPVGQERRPAGQQQDAHPRRPHARHERSAAWLVVPLY